MASPLEIYNEWQSRQIAQDFEHLGEFLGIPATGRDVSWEAVTMVKVKDSRVVENYTLLDLWGIYQQLMAPTPQQ